MKRHSILLILLIGILGLTTNSLFSQLLVEEVTGEITGYGSRSTMGWSFSVNSSVSIAALGVYDYGNNGFYNGWAPAMLWNSDREMIAYAEVMNYSTIYNGYRFVNLDTPVSLNVGSTYYLTTGASDVSAKELVIYGTPSRVNSAITFQGAYFSPYQYTFPENYLGDTAIFGANASLTPVPETGASGAILGLSFLIFGLWKHFANSKSFHY